MSRLKGFTPYEGLAPAVTYAPALQLLCKDHAKLRKSMEDILKFALKISHASGCSTSFVNEWLDREKKLRKAWQVHTLKEEQVLLTALSKYVDSDRGPLAVMRYEHERFDDLFNQFEKKAEALFQQPDNKELLNEALELFQNVARMKGDHCFKEEKTIFALAQNILPECEKLQMLHQIRRMKSATL